MTVAQSNANSAYNAFLGGYITYDQYAANAKLNGITPLAHPQGNQIKSTVQVLGVQTTANLQVTSLSNSPNRPSSPGEYIIVSGGKFSSSSGYDYAFVDTALKQIELLMDSGVDPSDIMWLLAKSGWSSQQIKYINEAADKLKINYKWFTEVANLTDYINAGGKDKRESHKIIGFYVFSHGYESSGGSIEFGHGNTGASAFSWKKSDLDKLNSTAFKNTTSWFYSCRTATAHENSFACKWSKITDGQTLAAHGQTTYKSINAFALVDYFERMKWKEGRGSYEKPGASFRLPTISSAAHWDMFTSGRQGK